MADESKTYQTNDGWTCSADHWPSLPSPPPAPAAGAGEAMGDDAKEWQRRLVALDDYAEKTLAAAMGEPVDADGHVLDERCGETMIDEAAAMIRDLRRQVAEKDVSIADKDLSWWQREKSNHELTRESLKHTSRWRDNYLAALQRIAGTDDSEECSCDYIIERAEKVRTDRDAALAREAEARRLLEESTRKCCHLVCDRVASWEACEKDTLADVFSCDEHRDDVAKDFAENGHGLHTWQPCQQEARAFLAAGTTENPSHG